MKRTFKDIFPILLLITGLVIFSHAVIPHDHHNDNSIEHHEHNNNSNSEHCHLLNHITIDKAISISGKIASHNRLDITATHVTGLCTKKPILTSIYLSDRVNLPDYFVCNKNTPSRGSPII